MTLEPASRDTLETLKATHSHYTHLPEPPSYNLHPESPLGGSWDLAKYSLGFRVFFCLRALFRLPGTDSGIRTAEGINQATLEADRQRKHFGLGTSLAQPSAQSSPSFTAAPSGSSS